MLTKISKQAFVITAICSRNKEMYGITVDKVASGYSLIWAFPLTKKQATNEGFEATTLSGNIDVDVNYPGCPHCKSVVCYHGEEYVVCPSCGMRGNVVKVDEVSLKTGSM